MEALNLPLGVRATAVLVDTSAFYAQLDRTDHHHEVAVASFRLLATQRRTLVLTNLIVAETHALISVKLSQHIAARWVDSVANLPILYERERDATTVRQLLAAHPYESYSYTDAFSFVAMDLLQVSHAFSFDRHFRRSEITLINQ